MQGKNIGKVVCLNCGTANKREDAECRKCLASLTIYSPPLSSACRPSKPPETAIEDVTSHTVSLKVPLVRMPKRE